MKNACLLFLGNSPTLLLVEKGNFVFKSHYGWESAGRLLAIAKNEIAFVGCRSSFFLKLNLSFKWAVKLRQILILWRRKERKDQIFSRRTNILGKGHSCFRATSDAIAVSVIPVVSLNFSFKVDSSVWHWLLWEFISGSACWTTWIKLRIRDLSGPSPLVKI